MVKRKRLQNIRFLKCTLLFLLFAPVPIQAAAPPNPPENLLTVVPENLVFGTTEVNAIIGDETITVTNHGTNDIEVGQIADFDTLFSPFSIVTDDCSNKPLEPLMNCAVVVHFVTDRLGEFSDSLVLPFKDPAEAPVTINVSGSITLVPAADITVTDSIEPVDDHNLLFGDITEGNLSETIVTIKNDGNADLVIGNIGLDVSPNAPFSIVNDACSGLTLLPSVNCTFGVQFAPVSTGTFSDNFDIPSNDSDENSVTVNVSGTGLTSVTNNPPSIPQLVYPASGQTGLPSSFNFIWGKAVDPNGDPVTYTLYYCDNPDVTLCASMTISKIDTGLFYDGIGGNWMVLLVGALFAGSPKRRKGVGIWLLMSLLIGGGMILTACGGGGEGGEEGSSVVDNAANETRPTPGTEELGYAVSALKSGTTYYWKVVVSDSKDIAETEIRSFTTFSTLNI